MNFSRRFHNDKKRPSESLNTTPTEEALDLVQQGDGHMAVRRYQQAIECYERANRLFIQLEDQFNHAITLGRIGSAYGSIGNKAEAIQNFETAFDISRMIGSNEIACSALGNLGLLAQHNNQFDKALE